MLPLQELIHRFEEGAGKKWFLLAFGIIAVVALVFVYNIREFKNMASVEAMDAAQLARNLAEGKGYTTDYIRPLSMWLLKQKQTDRGAKAPGPDTYRLREEHPHPDLANSPVYPLLLAGWMKILPFRYQIPEGIEFRISQPDRLVAFLNQLLFLIAAVLVFFIGRKVFDPTIGWVAAIVFLLTETLWRFSVAGLPTFLLMDFFLGLAWVLVRMEEGVRQEQKGPGWVLTMALAAGVLLGLGALTRYSFGWLVIPVAAYFLFFLGPQRLLASLLALVVLLAALTPWVMRNYSLSGTLFGIPGYSLMSEAGVSSRKIEGSLDPSADLEKFDFHGVRNKLVANLTPIVRDELPKLGGSWLTGLFLAGLLIPFRSLTLGRLRIFVIMSLAVLSVAQALGKTHLSIDSPELNSENWIILATPLVFIFGVGMFFTLLGQLQGEFPQARILIISLFVLIVSAPFILTLLPPRTYPFAYPPYYPPVIQTTAGWVQENELIMSDIPAAVAWYGRRRTLGFTPDLDKHFYEINDYHRPISALYLTHVTLDGKFLSQLLGPEARAWGLLLTDSLIRRDVPSRFPLRISAPGYFPDRLSDQLFLTDRERAWPPRPR